MGVENAQTIPPVPSGHVGFVVMGDFHQSVIGETTPLTNVPFDEYVSTAIRSPAGILASGYVNRTALALANDYTAQGWHTTFVGDYIDASHKSEWGLFKSLYAGGSFPLSAPGNHDGEALGTILNTEEPHGAAALLVSSKDPEDATQRLDDRGWMDDYLATRHERSVPFVEVQPETTVDPHNTEAFSAYWQSTPGGDFICALHMPHDVFEGGASILVQVRKVSHDLGGRPVYQIVLDTSDMSEGLPPNAAVGMISALQKDLVLLFLETMRTREKDPLFVLCGHMAPHEQDEKNWKKTGLDELYSRKDVFPVAFYANGHHRDITDETAGSRVSRVSPSYSVMTPAIVDAPNEFMLIDLAWDESTRTYVMTQEYQSIFPEENFNDSTIRQAVHAFDDALAHRHYATYSELSTRPLPTFVNILFRKKALKRDADLVQLQSLREDVSCLEKYLALLREDSVIESAFVQSVQNHLSALKNEARNGSLTAPSLTMLAEAQTLQKLVAQTPPDSKAAQFALLLAQVAADNEGVPGVRDGLKYLPPEPVPDQNVFHWNPETDLVTHTTRLPIL